MRYTDEYDDIKNIQIVPAVRNYVLEEAARVADQWAYSKSCTNDTCEHIRTAAAIAEAIRKLKEDE